MILINIFECFVILSGDKTFLMGEDICEVDCAVFGVLAQIKWNSFDSPYHKMLEGMQMLSFTLKFLAINFKDVTNFLRI